MKTLLSLLIIALFLTGCGETPPPETQPAPAATVATVPVTEVATEPTTEPTEPQPVYVPGVTAASDPDNWGISWEIVEGQSLLDSFSRADAIRFDPEEPYFALDGIATFRGDHLRSGATWGTTQVEEQRFARSWEAETNALYSADGNKWAGCGWTGQPLVVRWDEETKAIMNLYPEKQEKEDLVEVIYATLDGRIYFLDLDDGSRTRDPIFVGMTFKGSGALDPRGYPLMYVGAGDVNADHERPRMFVISLIDGSILYEYGHEETMQLRTDNNSWCAFDSSPLVHKESDTLIWPGENGLLYTIRLNTQYDPTAKTIRVDPETPVAIRYASERSNDKEYWYGFEASAAIVENYLYISENGGMFFCIDLNTMELVWAQDTRDDSNGSPVFEWISEEEAYVYTAPSLHWSDEGQGWGEICIYKLDALTGEILWQAPYDVSTKEGVSGGVQATALLGKPGTSIEGMLIVPLARYGGRYCGALVALDTQTGEELWQMYMPLYAWSSPVAVYEPDGTAYIVCGDADGTVTLVEGATGTPLATETVFSIIEASPIVFENKLVIGTRGYAIHCLTIE